MASRQASLGRGPARPLEASVKAIEVFDDPTLAKIAAVLDYEQPIWQPHTARDARQERSGSSKAGRGTYRCLARFVPHAMDGVELQDVSFDMGPSDVVESDCVVVGGIGPN